MSTLRRILLAIDGSPASARAILYATQLAKHDGAEVDVCTAIDELQAMLPVAEGLVYDATPMIAELRENATKHLESALAPLRAVGIVARGTILNGRPAAEIDGFARHARSEAIIVGTNGRSGFERALLGSVTTALLCVSDVPVIAVHAVDEDHTGPLLVAVDASLASSAALGFAIDRARIMRTPLHLLYVLEESNIERMSVALGLVAEQVRRHFENDAEFSLEVAAERVRRAGVMFSTELARGTAAEAILSAARRREASAIAIGTHGRGALERFIVGSVADGVVRQANVPVIVVRKRARAKRDFDPSLLLPSAVVAT